MAFAQTLLVVSAQAFEATSMSLPNESKKHTAKSDALYYAANFQCNANELLALLREIGCMKGQNHGEQKCFLIGPDPNIALLPRALEVYSQRDRRFQPAKTPQ